jgi:hypothetical protein
MASPPRSGPERLYLPGVLPPTGSMLPAHLCKPLRAPPYLNSTVFSTMNQIICKKYLAIQTNLCYDSIS